jgi:hypothetical protein
MPDVAEAVKLVTDPANVSRIHEPGSEEKFSVNQTRVIRALRDAGAGKAEARELAFKAVDEAGGAVEMRARRGMGARGAQGDAADELWWIPKSAVRF